MGKAYIIGTGPGDEELLTIKAVKVLEKCTAVLYDRLVSNNILNYLKEDCEIYYCGKEPGCHYNFHMNPSGVFHVPLNHITKEVVIQRSISIFHV